MQRGTTLLYVSHDLASVEASCDRAVWLANAEVRAAGPTKEVLALYRAAAQGEHAASITGFNRGDGRRVLKAEISAADGGQVRSECEWTSASPSTRPRPPTANFFLGVSQGTAFPMFIVEYNGSMPAGDFEVRCRLHHLPLAKGHYSLWPAITGYPRRRQTGHRSCPGARS